MTRKLKKAVQKRIAIQKESCFMLRQVYVFLLYKKVKREQRNNKIEKH
jgi:hypothetical protein